MSLIIMTRVTGEPVHTERASDDQLLRVKDAAIRRGEQLQNARKSFSILVADESNASEVYLEVTNLPRG